MLARAALAHFDAAHTLRDVLRSWQRVARQLGRIEATFARLACSNVLRGWRAACAAIEVLAASQRLRVQKVHAWSLIKPSWLHAWCDDVGERLRPLGAQLRFAMPLHEGLIDALARSTHAKLAPSASDRLLERPAVMPRATHQTVCVVLLGLLVRVVARLAQALQVVGVEEKAQVALVRCDVIGHRCRHQPVDLLAHATQRLGTQLGHAQLAPGGAVVEVVVVGSRHETKPAHLAVAGLSVGALWYAGTTSVPEL
jgi:hypothetical protein